MAISLTDAQWERIRRHFPEENIPDGRPGRKPVPAQRVLEAVLWILNTGAQWHMLPQCYPNYKTVHRRFQRWCERDVLREVLCALANELREQGGLDESECFVDAMFSPAKGGGEGVGPTKRGKGVKIMGIVDRGGLPLAASTHTVNHHEVTLVQLTFDFYMVEAKPENLIGDKAYDSDHLDEELRQQGIRMIAPQAAHPRRKAAAPLPAPVAGGALLLLDPVAPPNPDSLGVLCPELLRVRSTRLRPHPAETILR